MATLKLADGTEIFYKDWGPRDARPIVFHHGWPLSADDWDAQMLFFLSHGYRVIAHDRRGHGRSSQTDTGNDMNGSVALTDSGRRRGLCAERQSTLDNAISRQV
ncbi:MULTISPECIES: alpha/beta hydrolase, partial [unclassified Rhizobium]|uniref:alpha/beta fold hydrolase n=1 Tax=unclassified Rhizobium TaxID=2613769 RepID=UPI001833EAD4